ncbi:TetR/AcrR family transcriptional regulator [Nocardioides donggukensis]|uniref:TetR/AcrR family transcriptional regulator n=1 Tax=Nocardioides donggukensis TaxID=2774019 RepID=A0A927K657_9ACTN|nr:TetR/AcrR family transcriptional regulator [Nocardioides donggukensis]MBD8870543.1 TetR/AcrR family transcriptional regulator [Nocardioides donggukensis]
MTAVPRVRMAPGDRREQLLTLGVTLLATRSLDELSIDLLAEEAGISRGLLYHYFGNKHDFHEAVMRRAADDLIAQTAPPTAGEPLERLLASVAAYVDYVEANYEGYLSLVKGAAGGNQQMRQIYDEARGALTDRVFREDAQGSVVPDTRAARLMVRAWSAMAEDLVLAWVRDPEGVTREELLAALAASLPALVEILH